MADETKEVKTVKPKKPRPKEVTKVDVKTKPLIDWPEVEKELVSKFVKNSWTAERHRANPTHTVGVVISTVMPHVLKLLR